MGVVYRARDEKLERDVAIKLVDPGMLAGDEARRRFHREALALAKLSHAHIAAIYDVGGSESGAGESNDKDELDYIVMECVAGESLSAKLEDGPLSVKDATSIVLQIAEALEEAHEQGVVHRDLKPANVMITPKGQVKVLDFGIAKLLAPKDADATVSMATQGLVGTPLYMSPEQVNQLEVDERTDLWSLGVIYHECLTGSRPFQASTSVGVLRSITEEEAKPVSELRPGLPPDATRIVTRALTKDRKRRYQSAGEMVRDATDLLLQITATPLPPVEPEVRIPRKWGALGGVVLLLAIAAGFYLYHRSSRTHWAREQAIPQIAELVEARKPLEALATLKEAERYLPADPQLKELSDENTVISSVTSSPSGAKVEVRDYAGNGSWQSLGVTPVKDARIPQGIVEWRVSKTGTGEMIAAPRSSANLDFSLQDSTMAPPGMVFVPAGPEADYISFVGWIGPYDLPAYYVDRYEVTNRDYQKFVESGGYEKKEYWRERFKDSSLDLSWKDAMARFRDTSGRAGPANWAGGHYPEGAADLPVSGISWFEAAAYAAYAGKDLPALAQWFEVAPPDQSASIVSVSNLSTSGVARVGQYQGLGPYGTYDTAGNVREWVANPVDGELRFILGGSWKSPTYLYSSPEEASPFDRSETNGFRCVRNLTPLSKEATQPIKRVQRDFSKYKPAPDAVFNAYKLLYAYPDQPLNAKSEGVVKETVDWREEKVTFDAGYRGERLSAYLFLPKNAQPPFQTVLFFPSARVLFLPDSKNGKELGDVKFFDYILQSGRAVMYPTYEDTYERRINFELPSASQEIELTVDWYKDAARSLDYLATRKDIDNNRLGYLGVSMGSADGVIVTTLLQDRLKTAVFLDGGYFLNPPPAGADQADFAPRMKKPVLMVNGRYDFTFSVDKAQNPLFETLGTPAEEKMHVLLDTPHDVTEDRPRLTKAVLDWLDKYMGRVQ